MEGIRAIDESLMSHRKLLLLELECEGIFSYCND